MCKQLVMPIIKNNGSIGDNISKLKEENVELEEAYAGLMMKNDPRRLNHVAEEALDCLQVTIGILSKLEKELGVDLEKANDMHVAKLFNRQTWVVENGFIRIKID